MPTTASNLIAGPASAMYVAVFGATEPSDAAINSAPAASAWTDCGGTSSGVRLITNTEFQEITVDQIVEVVDRRLTKREFVIATSLAEATLDNLAVATNALSTTVVTGAGVKSWEPPADTPASFPNHRAIMFDGIAPGGFKRRVILRKAINTESVEASYAKDGQTVIPVTFTGHWVSSSIKPIRLIDATA